MSNEFIPGMVHPEEEYKELEDLSRKLGIPVPMMRIRVEATNPDGTQGEVYEGRMRTWNRNFWNAIFCGLSGFQAAADGSNNKYTSDTTFGAAHLSAKNTSGTVQDARVPYYNKLGLYCPKIVSASGDGAATGMVVGTSNTAESFEGYALGALCAHGTGAGQLSYAAMAFTQPTYSSLVWTQIATRYFNNNSGGTIVIAETGLYLTTLGGTFMAEHTVLPSTISVLTAGQLTVTYTFSLTFPA